MSTANAEILLVEDSADDLELILRTLRRKGTLEQVVIARDGAEALERLNRDPLPKIVLLDLKLPKVNGLEVLRWLKSGDRTRSIPVVILTSSQEPQDLVECYRIGVNSYIVKPVDYRQFVEAIEKVAEYWLSLNQLPQ